MKRLKHIVSFSGGVGSMLAGERLIKRYGAENVVFVFCDTSIEDDDLYDFVEAGSDLFGCEFVYLCDGRDPWQACADRKYMPNSRIAHCTVELKGKVFAKWLVENYKAHECIVHLGFDWTEAHRLVDSKKIYAPYKCFAPMCMAPYLTKTDMLHRLIDIGLWIPRMYKEGFSHNNCGGECPKAGQGHWKMMLDKRPDRYRRSEAKQEWLAEKLGAMKPFLRVTIDKKLVYMSLKEFREHIEAGKQCDLFDVGGCGCFSGEERLAEMVAA